MILVEELINIMLNLFFHWSQQLLRYATTEDEEPFDDDEDPEEKWEFDDLFV